MGHGKENHVVTAGAFPKLPMPWENGAPFMDITRVLMSI